MRRATCVIDTLRARRWILALGLAVLAAAALGEEPDALTTLHAIHSLTLAQARLELPVVFEATVTYYNPADVDLFVQDGDEAVYVEAKAGEDFRPGDQVLVRGRTRASFTPDVISDSITVVHHGTPPQPVTADFERLIRAQLDCMLVTVHATVRSADTISFGNTHVVNFRLLMDGGYIDATVIGDNPEMVKDLLDADVEVTGAVSGKFDSKMQMIGIVLEVPTFADVKVLERAATSPDALPVTSMDKVLSTYYVRDLSRRVRVRGTITYYQPGSAVVLQNGGHSIWIRVRTTDPMQIGDKADATGFPDARAGFLALDDGEIEDSHIFEPVEPQPSNFHDLADWNSGNAAGHQNDLVSIDGQVVAAVREESQDEYDLISDGKLFTAIYRHPPGNRPAPKMKEIAPGTRIRVTGICMVVQGDSTDPSAQEVPFDILMRSFDDIAVVAKPSLLSVRNLILLVGLLMALLFAAGARAWVVERKMRRQNAAAAYVEHQRSRILEDINGSRPLAGIIEAIAELASFKLQGAACWCQIADGARLGNCPAKLSPYRVAEETIPARTGAALGAMYAALDAASKPNAAEAETLSTAAALAALAIETRRLYSDLVHRSEFDLLTDIPNRFSLESYLDQQIEQARENAGIFGLIYIDLNDFKQVNDLYGHLVGDLYLQEVAKRMKLQIRGVDMLARLGGDEFAVVLPNVRNFAEVEEISQRLERCLDTPFSTEGYEVHGSASVGIALYPGDGTTRDSLFSAADAAMYVNKQTRRRSSEAPAEQGQAGSGADERV